MTTPDSLQQLRRPLAANVPDVSPIGLGTVKIGRNKGLKYPASFDLPSDADVSRLLETAQSLGINLIDTAPAYALAEQRLGTLLPGNREDWVIVTKAGEAFDGKRSSFDFSPSAITASVHNSLKHLNTEYLDAVLLHSNGEDTDILENSGGVEALSRLQDRGLIRAIGISTKTPEGALLAIEKGLDVLMLTLNPLHTEDLPAIDAAREKGVAVLIKKALVSGHVGPVGLDETGNRDLTPERCIDFALSTPGVTSVVVGTLSPSHLTQNVAAAVESLSRGAAHADQ